MLYIFIFFFLYLTANKDDYKMTDREIDGQSIGVRKMTDERGISWFSRRRRRLGLLLLLLLLLLLVAVVIVVVAGRLGKKRGAIYAESVACGAHDTKKLQHRVRTDVTARGTRFNERVVLRVSFVLRAACVNPTSDSLQVRHVVNGDITQVCRNMFCSDD